MSVLYVAVLAVIVVALLAVAVILFAYVGITSYQFKGGGNAHPIFPQEPL